MIRHGSAGRHRKLHELTRPRSTAYELDLRKLEAELIGPDQERNDRHEEAR